MLKLIPISILSNIRKILETISFLTIALIIKLGTEPLVLPAFSVSIGVMLIAIALS